MNSTQTASENAPLSPGEHAPVFRSVTYNGTPVKLDDFLGKKVWILFYRYFNCPMCMDHLFDVSERAKDLQALKIEVIAVFESENFRIRPTDRSRAFPRFPLIPDPDKELYQLYSVEKSWLGVFHPQVLSKLLHAFKRGFRQGPIEGDFTQLQASFLIHEDGTIFEAFYGRHIGDQISWERISKFGKEPRREPPEKTR